MESEQPIREPGLLRTYRAVLRGVTNGEFISKKLRLGAVYKARIHDLRKLMWAKYGGQTSDPIPGKEIAKTEEGTVWRWKLIVPDNCLDPADPLEMLPERKAYQEQRKKDLTQPQTACDSEQQATLPGM